jgi:integrase
MRGQIPCREADRVRNEKHRKQWRSTFDTYAAPVLGPKLVSDITVQDVLRVLEPIWRDKTETAKKLRGQDRGVLSWATVAGHREGDNPARWKGNLRNAAQAREGGEGGNQPALGAGRRVALVGRPGPARRHGRAALRIPDLTAARSGEVRGMTWDEIDLGDVATSCDFCDTGCGLDHPGVTHEERRASRAADARGRGAAGSLPRLDGSPYVFFAPRGGMLSDMSISAVMRRMQEAQVKAGRAGYLDPPANARRAARAALDLSAMGGGTGLSARHGRNRAGAFHRLGRGARLSAVRHARPAAGHDGGLSQDVMPWPGP